MFFTGFEDAVRHRLWASGDQFGTPWARILLGFRCFASMPHGCVHRPRPPTMRLCPPSCPPRAYYMHAFALFLRVSKMLYGTASGDQFGTPWARILLGFRCFASMPHGRVHRPCPPTTSLYDLSSYPPCAYLYVHAFAVFLRVSTMLYGTASGDQFGTPWARILLGFRCFASMPHGWVHRPCPPVMHLKMSPCPPCAYYTHAFAVFLRVSKMLYGTALGINLARLGLEFCWGSAVSQACLTDAFIGHVHLLRAYIIGSAIRHAPIYMSMLLLCFYGFRRCCTAPPLGINLARLGLECCWGSAVAQACLTDAFIGHVRLYAPICPAIRHAPIYPCFCPCF